MSYTQGKDLRGHAALVGNTNPLEGWVGGSLGRWVCACSHSTSMAACTSPLHAPQPAIKCLKQPPFSPPFGLLTFAEIHRVSTLVL